ncbi:MAG: lysophospholipid acyltransferase family protein [Planctomycetota bacterium]
MDNPSSLKSWELKPARDLGLPPAERFRSLKREAGLMETAVGRLWGGLLRLYLHGWHRLAVDGREHLPKTPPFILIANHSSHLDALVMASLVSGRLRDRLFPIAAGDTFFETPASSAFAAIVLNALPMWRKRCGQHALQELRDRLVGEPCAYILFPEGTRSRDGNLNPFKAGLGMLVAGTPVPVVPCFLAGTYAALPPKRKFPRWKKVRVRIGPPRIFQDVANDRRGWEHIATEMEGAVKSLMPGTIGGAAVESGGSQFRP